MNHKEFLKRGLKANHYQHIVPSVHQNLESQRIPQERVESYVIFLGPIIHLIVEESQRIPQERVESHAYHHPSSQKMIMNHKEFLKRGLKDTIHKGGEIKRR